MELTALVLITATLFVWALASARLQRADLTAPVVFTAVGAAMAWSGMLDVSSPPEAVTPVVEITLVWVLFSDAARLPLQQLRRDVGRYVRLLGVGLPLTIVFGWLLALWFFPHLRACGWPSSSAPRWRPPTPPWGSPWSRTRRCRHGSAS